MTREIFHALLDAAVIAAFLLAGSIWLLAVTSHLPI